MNKDEILAKSREENRAQDPYMMQVTLKGTGYASLAVITLGVIYTVIHYIKNGYINFELWSLLALYNAIVFSYRASKDKTKKNIISAVAYSLTALLVTAAAVITLILR
ncbi:MAG: DUF6442 family protein [Oscillospiraceae bacterium]